MSVSRRAAKFRVCVFGGVLSIFRQNSLKNVVLLLCAELRTAIRLQICQSVTEREGLVQNVRVNEGENATYNLTFWCEKWFVEFENVKIQSLDRVLDFFFLHPIFILAFPCWLTSTVYFVNWHRVASIAGDCVSCICLLFSTLSTEQFRGYSLWFPSKHTSQSVKMNFTKCIYFSIPRAISLSSNEFLRIMLFYVFRKYRQFYKRLSGSI